MGLGRDKYTEKIYFFWRGGCKKDRKKPKVDKAGVLITVAK